jgi:hypothetical protein
MTASSSDFSTRDSRWLATARAAAHLHPDVRLTAMVTALVVVLPAIFVTLQLSPYSSLNIAPELTHPFNDWPLGGLLNSIFSSLARWDAVHYLTIANDGYVASSVQTPDEARAAFYPVYPLLARLVGLGGLAPATVLVGAYMVSWIAFVGALEVLHRLAHLELGEDAARRAVLLMALFPTAFFYLAPYTESLFLLFSVSAFYAARRDRWALAGVCAAGAGGTRFIGLILVVPLALMFVDRYRDRASAGLRQWRRAVNPRILWLALIPVPLGLYSGWLYQARGDALAWLHAQQEGGPDRTFIPFRGVVEAWNQVWPWFEAVATSTATLPSMGRTVVEFWFLLFVLVALVGVLRRLPLHYGVYVFLSIAVPLSGPPNQLPLMGFPRYAGVLFPLALWGALVLRGRRFYVALATSAALLVMFTVQFATWGWVA